MSKSLKWLVIFYLGFMVSCAMTVLNIDWDKRMFQNVLVGVLTMVSIIFTILALKRAEEAEIEENDRQKATRQ